MKIDIEYFMNNEDETNDGPLPSLYHELEQMAGQNVVETIKLLIWVQQDGYDCTRLGELDDVLMGSPESWPALKEVSLSFNVTGISSLTNDTDSVNLNTLQNLPMTKLLESKQVEFNFRVVG